MAPAARRDYRTNMPALPQMVLLRRVGAAVSLRVGAAVSLRVGAAVSLRVGAAVYLVAVCLAGVGCASGRAFVPAEHVTALGPSRQLAAEYTVREDDRLVAEVKLWSHGATRNAGEEDDDATVVQVGFEIQNHTDGVVRLDTKELSLDDVKLGDQVLPRVPLLRVSGSPEVPAGEDRELTAVFRLPGSVWPTEVLGYRVAWTLTNGGRYQQKTPFLAAAPRYYYNDWPYYYSPFYFEVYGGWHWPYRYRPIRRYRPYYYRGYP
jgi:hypothetical protein